MLKMHNKTKLIINTTKNNTMELFKQYLLNKILIVQLMSNLLRFKQTNTSSPLSINKRMKSFFI